MADVVVKKLGPGKWTARLHKTVASGTSANQAIKNLMELLYAPSPAG